MNNPSFTTGRRKIFSNVEEINASNVQGVVEAALLVHNQNVVEIDWLFDLYKGKDAIIDSRSRDGMNEDINYKAFVSYYSLIADYTANLFMQNPIVLVNVDGENDVSDKISQYNKIKRATNAFARDKTTASHVSICGVGYRFLEMDRRHGYRDSVLSPRMTFSLYGDDTEDRSVAKVYMTNVPDESLVGADATQEIPIGMGMKRRYTVYLENETDKERNVKYEWTDGDEEVIESPLMDWGCPIIEYRMNPYYIGSFERVTSLIHLLSVLRSDGVNGVVQSVAGMLFLKNIDIGMDNPNDTAEEREAKEMQRERVRKEMKDYRQLWAKDNKETPASIEYITTELYNADIDVLYNGILNDIVTITSIPNSTVNLGGSGNTGAARTASGADKSLENAKNAEPYWYESAREQSWIELMILDHQKKGIGLEVGDFDFAMQRAIAVETQQAAQAYSNLINAGVRPSDAANFTQLTPDPTAWETRQNEWAKVLQERSVDTLGAEITESEGTDTEVVIGESNRNES